MRIDHHGWQIVLVLMAVAIYLISGALPKKTAVGAEAAAKWRAFRRYLEQIEKYERVAEQRQIFDSYLPYAVAFGLEETWVGAFANAETPAPRWYAPVWRMGSGPRSLSDSRRRGSDDRDWDWTMMTGRSWWDVTGGDRVASSVRNSRMAGSFAERSCQYGFSACMPGPRPAS